MHSTTTMTRRVVRSVPFRIVFAFLWLVATATATGRVPIVDPILKSILVAGSVVGGYVLYVRVVERRALFEFSLPGAPKEIAIGLALGTVLFSATIGIIWMLGYYTVTAVRAPTALLAPLGIALVTAIPEEILFRGVVFRIAEEGIGSVGALVLSSVLFGAAHLANPHATILSGVAIALEAGLLLGAAFMSTRRLWLPIGLHAAWNFTQAGIFGVAVSGRTVDGLLTSQLSGPALVSGGAFGAETSLPAVIVCVLAGCVLLRQSYARGLVRPPAWRARQYALELEDGVRLRP
jgi:membrane protease YdiL (CAAX protease family)